MYNQMCERDLQDMCFEVTMTVVKKSYDRIFF